MAAAAIRFENWVNGTQNNVIIYNPLVNVTYIEYDEVEPTLWLGVNGYPNSRLELEFPSPTDLYNFVWADTGLNWALTSSSDTDTVFIGSNRDLNRPDAPTTTTTTAAPTTTTTTVPGGTTTTTTSTSTTTTTTLATTTTTTIPPAPAAPRILWQWNKADSANALFQIYINDPDLELDPIVSSEVSIDRTTPVAYVAGDTLNVAIWAPFSTSSRIWIYEVTDLDNPASENPIQKAPEPVGVAIYQQGDLLTATIELVAGKIYFIEAESVY
jgi:hypothetical protein